MANEVVYIVTAKDGGWIGERAAKPVLSPDDALIYSREGALRRAAQDGTQAYSYNVSTWKLRRVHAKQEVQDA